MAPAWLRKRPSRPATTDAALLCPEIPLNLFRCRLFWRRNDEPLAYDATHRGKADPAAWTSRHDQERQGAGIAAARRRAVAAVAHIRQRKCPCLQPRRTHRF